MLHTHRLEQCKEYVTKTHWFSPRHRDQAQEFAGGVVVQQAPCRASDFPSSASVRHHHHLAHVYYAYDGRPGKYYLSDLTRVLSAVFFGLLELVSRGTTTGLCIVPRSLAGMVYMAWIEQVVDHNHNLVSEPDPSHGRVFLGLLTENKRAIIISGAMPDPENSNCMQIALYPGYNPSGACAQQLIPAENNRWSVRFL